MEKLKEVINRTLQNYNPYQIVLYGSYSRGNFKPQSDIDIMIFFSKKKLPSEKIIIEILKNLKKNTGKNIDLVVMKYMNKWINILECDKCFMDNVRFDAKYLLTGPASEIFDMSEKIGLYKI